LRDAAGQLIESTVRTVRRKEPVDEAYMDKLYDETYTAFHLDQIQVDGEWKQDFGALPKTSVFLLTALGVIWAVLGIFAVGGVLKRRKKH
jgi:multiple sugar transport system substrate-binding protein